MKSEVITFAHDVETGKPIQTTVKRLIENRELWEGSSGSGKSHGMVTMIEQTDGLCQRIVIDLEGEYFTLKNNFSFLLVGKSTDKVEVDLELNTNDVHIEKLAEKLLLKSVDTIVDLSEIDNPTHFISVFFNALLRYSKVMKRPLLVFLDEAQEFCLSEDTELLTENGWKKYTEIKVGDLAYSFNKKNKSVKLHPIKRIIKYKNNKDMYHMFNDHTIDSLVTKKHRVLCSTRTTVGKKFNKKYKMTDLKFVEASNLPTSFTIPILGEYDHTELKIIDDDLLKIIGWILTDGNIHKFKKTEKIYYEFTQNKSKGKILKEMIETVKRRFPNHSIYKTPANKRRIAGNPKISNVSESFNFYLGRDASDELDNYLKGQAHRIPRIILNKCSKRQLLILFKAIMQGDGTTDKTVNGFIRRKLYCGYNDLLADDYLELCIKIGLSGTKKILKSKKLAILISEIRKTASVKKANLVKYRGMVWDITIANGAFCARRNGKPFITGNCPEKGMGKEESLKAVMRMAKRGRKHGIGLICGTQAIADFSKNVVRQLRTRFIGDCTYENDIKAACESLGFPKERRKELSNLAENHEFFVAGQGIMIDGKRPTKVLKIKAIQNKTKLYDFDFKSNVKIHEKNPKAMKELISEFADIPQIIDSELSEIEALRKDKIDLQVKLNNALKSTPLISSNQSHTVKIDPQLIQKAEQIGIAKGFNQGVQKTKLILQPYIDRIEKTYNILLERYNQVNILTKDEFKDLSDIKHGLDLKLPSVPETVFPDRTTITKKTTNGFHDAIVKEKSIDNKNLVMNEDQKVTGGALRMLKVCKHYGIISKAKMCLYSKLGPTNGTTTNYISELRTKGLLEDIEDGQFQITDLGNLIAGETDSVPKSSEVLVAMWASKFTVKVNEMMKQLVSVYPNSLSREVLAQSVGLQISGTFTNYMSELRKNNILVNSGEGIKASDDLFPERA